MGKFIVAIFVLVQQPDGTYKNLEEHLKSQSKKSEARVDAEKSLIEKMVSGFKVETN